MRDDPAWQRYWRYLTARFRGDVDDELDFHVEMRASELERHGLPPDAARREAQRRLGDRTRIRTTLQRIERKRGQRMRLSFLLQELMQDVRYGVRGLLKRPGYVLMTASSLALGIAATTVVLSIIDAYLLRPLPVQNPEDLVVVGASNRTSGSMVASVLSLPTARDVADRTDLFQGAAAVTMVIAAARPTASDPAERGLYSAVSGNYFSMLGVPAAIGRTLTPEDDRQRERVVVLGHRTWTTRFASDPTVVGKTIRLNTVEFVVVGVAPATFRGTEPIFEAVGFVPSSVLGVLVPGLAGFEERRAMDAGRFTVLARRQPTRSVAEINVALGVLSQQIEAAYPEAGEQFRLVAFSETRARPTLPAAGWMLPVATVFATLALLVLLTACVNATNLILARGSTRATELAVRQALGASRARLASQLLTETLLLAFLALVGGWVLARLAVGALTSIPLAVDGLPLSYGLTLDGRVFGMTVALTLLVGLVAGVGPALSASRFALQQRLRDGGRSGSSRGGRRARGALVVAQVAASLVVLVSAGLFVVSARQAGNVDLGFRSDHVLTFGVDADLAHYAEPEARAAFDRIERAVEQVSGVVSTAWANTVPIQKGAVAMNEAQADGDITVGLFSASVGPRYFEVLEMPVLEGRGFAVTDDSASAGVVVVNQQAAATLWPGQSALGRVVRLVRDGPPLEVVGVVKDSRYLTIAEAPRPYLYRPLAQQHAAAVYLHVRTAADPAGLIGPVRAAAAAIDKDMAPFEVRTMDDAIDTSPNGTMIFRIGAAFASVIGLLAVLLTLVGLYGVIAYSVAQRTQEIGLRMALGATQRAVVRSILADGGKLAFAGIALGLVAALMVSRMLAPLLVGGRGADVVIFAAVAIGLGLAALLSAYLPARRAARVDPVNALNDG